VRSLAVFLSGLAATITGAFIRSCSSAGFPAEFYQSWCGLSPLEAAAMHPHCAGCALTIAGIAFIAVSPILFALDAARKQAMR
jgi:hypothetical protein